MCAYKNHCDCCEDHSVWLDMNQIHLTPEFILNHYAKKFNWGMVIVVREGSEEEEATTVWDFQGNPSWTVPGTYRVFGE